jgi:hypothetical protein
MVRSFSQGISGLRRRAPVVLLATGVVALVCLQSAGAADRTAHAAAVDHSFVIRCDFSHAAPDDPIVYPGQPGRSHEHDFFGNVSANAFSTPSSLPSHTSTCNHAGDDSAYWAPVLYVGGKPVEPGQATIYYRRLTTGPVHPFPSGLEMVAGNSHAVLPQPASVTSWQCEGLKTRAYSARAVPMEDQALGPGGTPYCAAPTSLELLVNFPDCSNGKPTSANHKSQMAYSVGGRCPASHPLAVPAISIVLRYPQITSSDVFLASGGVNSGHADFMDGWSKAALSQVVTGCLNLTRVCGYPLEPGALN